MLALDSSRKWASSGSWSNSQRSAKFCSDLCGSLDPIVRRYLPNNKASVTCRHIVITNEGKGVAGEWLLDGIWTTDQEVKSSRIPISVECALECESSTSTKEFFSDFSKLLAVYAPVRLFFAGLNQTTLRGANSYMDTRKRQVAVLLENLKANALGEWYIAFWPSPLNKGGKSLWSKLDQGLYRHLDRIFLFRYLGHGFEAVHKGQ